MLNVLKCARPRRRFAANNWKEWDKPWLFASIFLHCHDILLRLLPLVLQSEDGDQPDEHELREQADANHGVRRNDDDDEVMQKRQEQAQHKRSTRDLLARENVKDELFILTAALRPELRLMSVVLHENGSQWQWEQMRQQDRTGRREYIVQKFHRQHYLDPALLDLGTILADDAAWPQLSRTVRNASFIARCVLRCGAVLHELMGKSTKAFPYRLFELIDGNEDLAIEIAGLPACVVDPFTQEFRRQFPTAQALMSDAAQAILTALASAEECTTFSTERAHSVNLRRQLARASTHSAELAFLSVRHQRRAAVPWMDTWLQEQHEEAKHDDDRPKKVGRKRKRAQPKRRGGGGAWRAYQHVQSEGLRLNPRQLAEGYRRLTDEQRAFYTRLGEAGTRAHALGSRAFPAHHRHGQAVHVEVTTHVTKEPIY